MSELKNKIRTMVVLVVFIFVSSVQVIQVSAQPIQTKNQTDIVSFAQSKAKYYVGDRLIRVQNIGNNYKNTGHIRITFNASNYKSYGLIGYGAVHDSLNILSNFKVRADYNDVTFLVNYSGNAFNGNMLWVTVTKDTIQRTNWNKVFPKDLSKLSSYYYLNNIFNFSMFN